MNKTGKKSKAKEDHEESLSVSQSLLEEQSASDEDLSSLDDMYVNTSVDQSTSV